MSSSTKADAVKEIAKGIKGLERRLERNVKEICTTLTALLLEPNELPGRDSDLTVKLRKHLSDIYWTLKLHLFFHLGEYTALTHEGLERFGKSLKLTNDELQTLPSEKHAIDPGSKVLEALSDIVERSVDARGTKPHADAVMESASVLFSRLPSKNRFRPKVLAQVSHNGVFFVGSSISVSPFLRPLCLHNRIQHFKHNLKKAIVFSKSLRNIADNEAMSWSSSAYEMKETDTANETRHRQEKSYTEPKPHCQNCKMMFKNLNGFIDCEDAASVGGDTFLGACAEYCPVNELVVDDSDASSGVDAVVFRKLKIHMNRCSLLFRDYTKIAIKCVDAHDSGDIKRMEDIYPEVISKIHIFGFKPQCKM